MANRPKNPVTARMFLYGFLLALAVVGVMVILTATGVMAA